MESTPGIVLLVVFFVLALAIGPNGPKRRRRKGGMSQSWNA